MSHLSLHSRHIDHVPHIAHNSDHTEPYPLDCEWVRVHHTVNGWDWSCRYCNNWHTTGGYIYNDEDVIEWAYPDYKAQVEQLRKGRGAL